MSIYGVPYVSEGFQSWMFKGLSFIVPFLIAGYVSTDVAIITSLQAKKKKTETNLLAMEALRLAMMVMLEIIT